MWLPVQTLVAAFKLMGAFAIRCHLSVDGS
jgi:hypothetical protein